MDKEKKINLLTTIILIGFVFGIIYHYIWKFYFGSYQALSTFLFPTNGSFCDFWGSFEYIKDLKPYQGDAGLWVTYFPVAYIFTIPFAFIKNLMISYLIYIMPFISYLIYMNIKNFNCKTFSKIQNFQNIFILTFMTYPFLYSLDKGNFDMFMFVILGLFVYAFKKEKYLLAAILLTIENSIKPFTFLFLVLFLIKKRYKEFFLSLILTIILILGGFLIFPDNYLSQVINFLATMMFFKDRYALNIKEDFGMYYASSLFMVLKLIFCKLTLKPIISTVLLTKIYDCFCYVITAVTIFFVCIEKTYWKQLTLLICNFLLLPYITYDYKLMFLLIPIWLFVNTKEKTKFDLAYTICFALLFIPKHILIMQPQLSPTMAKYFSLSIIINPVIMIILTLLIIYERLCIRGKSEL